MAEDSSTAPAGRSTLTRVFGLRLFFQPRARARLLHASAVLTVLAYLYTSIVQVVTLQGLDLKYDFLQFYDAAAALNHGGDPYAAFLNGCPGFHWCLGGYIYPPLLAELMRPLALLSPQSAVRAWLVVSQLCLLVAALVLWRALRGRAPTAALSLLLVASLFFRPLQYTLYFAQVGLILVLVLAFASSRFMAGDDEPAVGAAVGLATILRVSPILLLPALLRRPRALLAMLATAGVTTAVLAVLTPYTAEYFTQVLPRIGGSTSNLDNLAPQGVLLRAAALWGLPPPGGAPATVVIALLVLGPTALLALSRDRSTARRGAVIGAFLAAMPIVSSLTWHHHLVTELVAYAALLPALCRPGMRLPVVLAAVSYPLMWLDRHYTDGLTVSLGLAQPAGWRVAPFLLVTGLNLVGMVCLWLSALTALGRLDHSPGVDSPQGTVRV
jgi:hypothetical protein